jgi:hypothetical protein
VRRARLLGEPLGLRGHQLDRGVQAGVTECLLDPKVSPSETPASPPCSRAPTQRIVRLADRHYENAVRQLLEAPELAVGFRSPSSAPTAFFEELEKQPVGEALAAQLQSSAEALALEAVSRAHALFPCPSATTTADGCVREWLKRVVSRAYRRTLTADELEDYAALYDVGAENGAESGVRLVFEAQSS